MQSYRRLLYASVIAPALMLAIGLSALGTLQQEIFPFYSWFLFALVPNAKSTYQIVILSSGGKTLPSPRMYNEADDIVSNPHSIVAYKVMQRLGKACKHGDAAGIARERHFIEANFKPGTQYEVLRLHSDPIERWRTHEVVIREVVGTFEAGGTVPAIVPATAPTER